MNTETKEVAVNVIDAKSPEQQKITNNQFVPFNNSLAIMARTLIADAGGHVYRTSVPGEVLKNVFLSSLAPEDRIRYNCRCCLKFIEKYGNLVVITPGTFMTYSVLWSDPDTPAPFVAAVTAMREFVERADIVGPYFREHDDIDMGVPDAGGFKHLHISTVGTRVGPNSIIDAVANQNVAIESYKTVVATVGKYTSKRIELLATVFAHDPRLKGAAKFQERVDWLWSLLETHEKLKHSRAKDNLIWYNASRASPGKINIATSGSILEDLLNTAQKGEDLEGQIRMFLSNADVTKYMHSTEAPLEGQLEMAKQIVAKMGNEKSFYRRAARLDELPTSWAPKAPKETVDQGIFGSVKSRQELEEKEENRFFVGGHISLRTFMDDVLPTAEHIAIDTTYGAEFDIVSLATAVHPEAPPILAYDSEEKRIPFSLFQRQPRYFSSWGIRPSRLVAVKAIVPLTDGLEKMGGIAVTNETFLFVLDGLELPEKIQSCLFASEMRPELHQIRQFVEVFSKNNALADIKGGFLALHMGGNPMPNLRVQVVTGNVTKQYDIVIVR